MQLTVRDAARILGVPESTIYAWIADDGLPAYRLNEQYCFNRSELLEWVASHKGTKKVRLSPELFQAPIGTTPSDLAAALEAGGIHPHIPGTDPECVLHAVVQVMHLPSDMDRDSLLQILLARERLGTTAIGDGIAIPHVRNPLVLNVKNPLVTLCYLESPVDFGARDGKRVSTLFTLIAPTIRSHLHLLSRLTMALGVPDFKAAVGRQAAADEVLREARKVEATLTPKP